MHSSILKLHATHTSIFIAFVGYLCRVANTAQQEVYSITFLLCAVRVAYFSAVLRLERGGGQWSDEWEWKAFICFEELSDAIYATLCSVAGLFWLELYYISVDRSPIFTDLVRPAVNALNLVAYAAIMVVLLVLVLSPSSDPDGFGPDSFGDRLITYCSALVAALFLGMALFCGAAVGLAGRELAVAPVPLALRSNRVDRLRFLCGALATSLVARAVCDLTSLGRSLSAQLQLLTSSGQGVAAFSVWSFFLLLELLPALLLLLSFTFRAEDTLTQPDRFESLDVDWEVGPSPLLFLGEI
jgi:hypothetical protein